MKRIVLDSGIEFNIERKKVKNINLRINKECEIYVSANNTISELKIVNFVKSKERWILKKIDEIKSKTIISIEKRKYINGECYFILGEKYLLKVSVGIENRIIEKGLFIYLFIDDLENFSLRKELVDNWYESKVGNIFNEILNKMIVYLQAYYNKIPLIDHKYFSDKWGVCMVRKNKIILNTDLIYVPKECIEFVILHELIHFLHPNHSKDFYLLLEELMPDWKLKNKTLNQFIIKKL